MGHSVVTKDPHFLVPSDRNCHFQFCTAVIHYSLADPIFVSDNVTFILEKGKSACSHTEISVGIVSSFVTSPRGPNSARWPKISYEIVRSTKQKN